MSVSRSLSVSAALLLGACSAQAGDAPFGFESDGGGGAESDSGATDGGSGSAGGSATGETASGGTGGGTSGGTGDTDGGGSSGASTDATGGTDATASGGTGGGVTAGSASGGTSGGSTGGSSGSTGDPVCAEENVVFDVTIPTVVLLIDQSGSMDAGFGNGTRWTTVRDALTDPATGVVKTLEDQVRFGLSLYTSFNGDAGGTCPVLTEIAPDLSNHAAIEMAFFDNQPEDETPTGEALAAVAMALDADPSQDGKFIVLATDGEPDTCAVPNPQNGQGEAVAAAQMAHALGIQTFVISVGTQVSESHLQDMANAGQGVGMGDPDAAFYQATDQQELFDAFDQIINGVRDCKLALQGSITEGFEDQCAVTIDGSPVPYDDPDGWRMNDPTEIELIGSSCQAIQSGMVEVDVSCPCGVIIPQ